jgi:hypothetical protein
MHKYFVAAAAIILSSPALAVTTTIVGNNLGGPTYNRVIEAGNSLSGVGTAVTYQTYAFNVSTAGAYTITADSSALFDTFLVLYKNTFDPSSALTNFVVASDDTTGSVLSASQFTQSLTTNTNYIAVVSGYSNFDAGRYALTFSGPAAVNFNSLVSAAPEPATWGMMILGFGLAGAALRRKRAASADRQAFANAV